MLSLSKSSLAELGSSESFKLLLGLTLVTIIEAVCYAWIEVVLYTSDSLILSNTWLFGRYTTYHIVLAVLVIAMIFGVGFFGSVVLSQRGFEKFMLLASGDFLLWVLLEDEFFFVFSGTRHTPTDWSSSFLGSVSLFGYYIPIWYFLTTILTFVFWYTGLTWPETKESH
ncbi:MAG: hypothetical protein ACREBS_04675 [Nitrososphaerales archaeon]